MYLFFLLIFVLILLIIYYIKNIVKPEVKEVESMLDGRSYVVRDLDDKDEAAYILALVRKRIFKLKTHFDENPNKYPEYQQYIDQFCKRIKGVVISENSPNELYTSYSINKGEEIVLCLRSKKNNSLHDLNLIMYVVLHELAHVACPEHNHTELFKKIFIFFLEVGTNIGVYDYVEYDVNPHEYCGMTLTENLLKRKAGHVYQDKTDPDEESFDQEHLDVIHEAEKPNLAIDIIDYDQNLNPSEPSTEMISKETLDQIINELHYEMNAHSM
jgi:hypothetical protein